MKIAIVHDYLVSSGGAEKCLKAFTEIFPNAPIYTLFYYKKYFPELDSLNIKVSFLNKIPYLKRKHYIFLPLYSMAVASLRLSGYDVILSSSWAWSKGIRKDPGACHICYCHTPMRFAHYKDVKEVSLANKNMLLKWAARRSVNRLKKWDLNNCNNVDYFISTSENVRGRIEAFYNRDSVIIHPPLETTKFILGKEANPGSYFLIVSRLVPYKRVDIAVKAFSELKLPLKIVGTGNEFKRLSKMAASNIEFLKYISQEKLVGLYQNCKAVILAQEEDWGIAGLEAQACGKPLIAYGKGGALEYVVENKTGHLFYEQTTESLKNVVKEFNDMKFNSETIRSNVLQYDRKLFKKKIEVFVNEKYRELKARDEDIKRTYKRNFSYGPATKELSVKYNEIFNLKRPLKERTCKLMFDKIFSFIALVLMSPALIFILLAYFIDGLIHPWHKAPILASYKSSSQGKDFTKYKFNIAKGSAIDKGARREKKYSAYPSPWNSDNLTCVGKFLKKHYLDELPQIFNIFKGDISFVGIRPLAKEHYESDIQNGHPRRRILKAGIFSQTHVRKGTPDLNNPALDYDYIEKVMKLSCCSLLWLDIRIMAKGSIMILRGEKKVSNA